MTKVMETDSARWRNGESCVHKIKRFQNLFSVAEESNVPKRQEFSAAFPRDLGVLARPHCKEEGPDHQLGGSNVESELGYLGLGNDLF